MHEVVYTERTGVPVRFPFSLNGIFRRVAYLWQRVSPMHTVGLTRPPQVRPLNPHNSLLHMTSTNTHGAGLGRLFNLCAVLTVLLLGAGVGQAQTTIFVNNDGGNNQNTGQTANNQSNNGPVATLDEALARVNAGFGAGAPYTIEFEANGFSTPYFLNQNIGDAASNRERGITFRARNDEGPGDVVALSIENVPGDRLTFSDNASFASAGATFRLFGDEDQTIDFQSGTIALGTGVVSLSGVEEIEVTNAAVTGVPTYDNVNPDDANDPFDNSIPTQFTFNGTVGTTGVNPSGTIIPRLIDVATGGDEVTITVDLPAAANTLQLGASPIQLNDDGGNVTVEFDDDGNIAGTFNIRDGNGTAANGFNGSVLFDSNDYDVNFGDVNVGSSATLLFEDNATVASFTQTGGEVLAAGNYELTIEDGDFTRTAGDFDDSFVLTFDSDDDQTFASGTGLDLEGLRFEGGDRTVTFATGAEVDILGNTGFSIGDDADFFVDDDINVIGNGATVAINSGAGTTSVDGTLNDVLVVFENGGFLGGTGVYDDIRLDGNVDLSPLADADFTGSLFLLNGTLTARTGTITIDPDGPTGPAVGVTSDFTGDLSPAGDDSEVFIDITNNATGIEEVLADGEFSGFNGDEQEYDLFISDDTTGDDDYTLDGTFDLDFVRNFTIDANDGDVTIDDDSFDGDALKEISGNLVVRGADAFLQIGGGTLSVGGNLDVQSNGEVTLVNDNGAGNLRVTGPSNRVSGEINGNGGAFQLSDTAVVTGTEDAIVSAPIVLFGDDAAATLTGFEQVNGAISDAGFEGGTLTLSLLADGEGSGAETRAGNVTSQVTLDESTLLLGSNVQFTSAQTLNIFELNTGESAYIFYTASSQQLTLGSDVVGLGSVWLATGLTSAVPDRTLADGDLNGDGFVNAADNVIADALIEEVTRPGVTGTFLVPALNAPDFIDEAGGIATDGTSIPDGFADQDLNRDGNIDRNTGTAIGADQAIYNAVAAVAAPDDIVNTDDIQAIAGAIDGMGNVLVNEFADLDGDGDVDAEDQAIYDLADFNNNGVVGLGDRDLAVAASSSGTPTFADLTLECFVGDYSATYNPGNFATATLPAGCEDTYTVGAGAPTLGADGFVDSDLDFDGDVDGVDRLLLVNFDRFGGPAGGPVTASGPNGFVSELDVAGFRLADDEDNTTFDGDLDGGDGDINGDGSIDEDDQDIATFADADGDGDVDNNDLLVFASADENADGLLDGFNVTVGGVTRSADVNGDGDFDATDRAILLLAGAGVNNTAPDSIDLVGQTGVTSVTIPTFHVGNRGLGEVDIVEQVTVTNLLFLDGTLDAASADVATGTGAVDYAITLADGPRAANQDRTRLRLGNGYDVINNAGNEVIFGTIVNVEDQEDGAVDPFTVATLASGNVGEFFVSGSPALPVASASTQGEFDIESLRVAAGETFAVNGHKFELTGDLTISGNDVITNNGTRTNNVPNVRRDGTGIPFSEISFVGSDDSMINITGPTLLGDGVDIRINKDAGSSVILDEGALIFDDEFDSTPSTSTDDLNDETLFLESGVFVVGTQDQQQTVYVRLDHENTPQTFGDIDDGQGFVLVSAVGQDASVVLTDSYIAGNVRKRVANVGTQTPGRVIYPTGEMAANDDDDRDYAPFTFDFESNGAGATFGLRSINVTFVDESPGVNASLPVDGTPSIQGPAGFYWLVSTTGTALGQGTTFNVEARADDFEIVNNIDNLQLIRRQDGSVTNNPYTGVGGLASTFTIDPDGAEDGDLNDDYVVVQESGVESFLGPQGTVVTFGLTTSQNPVANDPTAASVPTEFALNGTFPNPFSARAELSFDLPEAATVTLEVFDVMGRQVLNVNTGGLNAGGDQRIAIDGSSLASGVYVYRLRAAGATDTWTRSGQITLAR